MIFYITNNTKDEFEKEYDFSFYLFKSSENESYLLII